jgi:diguanylate cyclase (GGDEF)-like protein
VNDTFGHQTGDYVLEKLASILRLQSRKDDIIARYGGEEFVILLPHTDILESKAVAENLRQSIAYSTWDMGQITVSMGIATFISIDSETTLLQKADQALYASKEQGRNRVTHIIDLNEKLL